MLLGIHCAFHEALYTERDECQEQDKAQLKYQFIPTAFRKTQVEKFLYHCIQYNALHIEVTAFYCKASQHFSEKSHLAFFLTKPEVFPDTTAISCHRQFRFAASENLADFNQVFLPFPCLSINLPGQTSVLCKSSQLSQLLTPINMHLLHMPGNWQVLGNEGESRPNQNQTHFQRSSHHRSYMLEFTRKISIDPNHIWISLEPPSYHSVKFQAEVLFKKKKKR